MTKSYHDLEATTYEKVRNKKISRIHGKPTWSSKEELLREAEEVALECDVHYPWAGEFGLLATVIGQARYLAEAGLNYVTPVQPVDMPPPAVAGGTAAVIRAWESTNDLDRRNFAIFKGFKTAICENIRDALDLQYYEQIREVTFGFKRRTFRSYIEHLEAHWCILDCKTIESLKQNWKRDWGAEEHITGYSRRLDQEQVTLARDNILISDADKLHQYILQMYKCNYFDQPMMTEWEKKAIVDKTYANAVIFFNDKMASIEKYQENSGNSAKRNGFDSANSALEIADQMKSILKEHMSSNGEEAKAEHALQMATMQSAKDRQENEMAVMRKEISTLTRALTTLTHKMVEKKSSTRGGGKRGEDHESDGGYETDESEKENIKPPRKTK